jgi:hypothetical protein
MDKCFDNNGFSGINTDRQFIIYESSISQTKSDESENKKGQSTTDLFALSDKSQSMIGFFKLSCLQ